MHKAAMLNEPEACRSATSATAELPAGLTLEALERHKKRQEALRSASEKPLPGPLLAAFADGAQTWRWGSEPGAEFSLLPVVASHKIFLQQIGSPFPGLLMALGDLGGLQGEERIAKLNEQVQRMRRSGESDAELEGRLFEETVESFFVFTRPPAEIRKLLRLGRAAFNEEAMAAIADKIPMEKLAELQSVVMMHLLGGVATAVAYAAESAEGASFSKPLAAMMGSAGGSTT